ncbi:MAG TPA: hypothetical protein VK137_12950 [Planctomycetaceae bacterium]|nr:hypothetical protein [Planctomycetaceae bacterium]
MSCGDLAEAALSSGNVAPTRRFPASGNHVDFPNLFFRLRLNELRIEICAPAQKM